MRCVIKIFLTLFNKSSIVIKYIKSRLNLLSTTIALRKLDLAVFGSLAICHLMQMQHSVGV